MECTLPTVDLAQDRRILGVERAFAHLKQWRGLATCYDKHVATYRSGAVVRVTILCLKR